MIFGPPKAQTCLKVNTVYLRKYLPGCLSSNTVEAKPAKHLGCPQNGLMCPGTQCMCIIYLLIYQQIQSNCRQIHHHLSVWYGKNSCFRGASQFVYDCMSLEFHSINVGIQGPDIWRDFGAEAISVDEKVPVRGLRMRCDRLGWGGRGWMVGSTPGYQCGGYGNLIIPDIQYICIYIYGTVYIYLHLYILVTVFG